jgi:hypothetical protein
LLPSGPSRTELARTASTTATAGATSATAAAAAQRRGPPTPPLRRRGVESLGGAGYRHGVVRSDYAFEGPPGKHYTCGPERVRMAKFAKADSDRYGRKRRRR